MSSKLIQTTNDWTLTILRLAAGIMIFPHGLQKTFGWFGGAGFSAQMAGFERSHIPAVFAFPGDYGGISGRARTHFRVLTRESQPSVSPSI